MGPGRWGHAAKTPLHPAVSSVRETNQINRLPAKGTDRPVPGPQTAQRQASSLPMPYTTGRAAAGSNRRT